LGFDALVNGKFSFNIFNLGNGQGFSNMEVIEMARQITGHQIPVTIAPRRAGDAAKLISASTKAREILGWTPQYGDLKTIVSSAWENRRQGLINE
jgi:UDP-glucose 4-epimerase